MSHRIVRYETTAGDEKWAIWSTIVDDWTFFDLTERELIRTETQTGTEPRSVVEKRVERIKERDAQVDPRYRGGIPPAEAIVELERELVEGEV